MHKKVLVVGAFSPDPHVYTYATSFYKTLSALFNTVESFNYRRGYFVNLRLIAKVKAFKPDIVFIIKGELIKAKTIRTIKALGATVINFYPDNPFAVWNGNSNAQVLASLPLFDCFLFWAPDLFPALQAAGCKHTCFMPFAFDQELFDQPIPKLDTTYQTDVSFVGTWEPAREAMLSQLITRMPELNLAIWGNDWNTKATNPAIKPYLRGNAIYGSSMIQAFRNANIVLNFVRQQNLGAHNMRTMEAPASVGFLLTERTKQQAQQLFTEGENIACFDGIDELIAKIRFYLQDEKTRRAITQKSFLHVQRYTLDTQLRAYFAQCPLFTQQPKVCNDHAYEKTKNCHPHHPQ